MLRPITPRPIQPIRVLPGSTLMPVRLSGIDARSFRGPGGAVAEYRVYLRVHNSTTPHGFRPAYWIGADDPV